MTGVTLQVNLLKSPGLPGTENFPCILLPVAHPERVVEEPCLQGDVGNCQLGSVPVTARRLQGQGQVAISLNWSGVQGQDEIFQAWPSDSPGHVRVFRFGERVEREGYVDCLSLLKSVKLKLGKRLC